MGFPPALRLLEFCVDFFARGYALGLQLAQLTFDMAFVFYDPAAIRLLLSVGHISDDVAADLLMHDPLPYRVVDGVCVADQISRCNVDQISPGDVDQISPGNVDQISPGQFF